MNLLEFQGKTFLKAHGVPIPQHLLVKDLDALDELSYPLVLKSQVMIGGRGKNGGILPAATPEEAKKKYAELKKKPIRGLMPFGILAESQVKIHRELYFGISINRRSKCVTLIFSERGGVNIERLPADQIKRVDLNPIIGLQRHHFTALFQGSNLSQEIQAELQALTAKLLKLYQDFSLELLEINPLVITDEKKLMALDAKLIIDDSCAEAVKSAFPPLPDTPGTQLGSPVERISKQLGINGVRLDGEIGVVTSGAGVGMATIDTLKALGCTAHSFADMGALVYNPEALEAIITAIIKENPKTLLCNFYFQVASCRTFAKAIAAAIQKTGVRLPVIVRARGRELEEAWEILAQVTQEVYMDFEEACARAAMLT